MQNNAIVRAARILLDYAESRDLTRTRQNGERQSLMLGKAEITPGFVDELRKALDGEVQVVVSKDWGAREAAAMLEVAVRALAKMVQGERTIYIADEVFVARCGRRNWLVGGKVCSEYDTAEGAVLAALRAAIGEQP